MRGEVGVKNECHLLRVPPPLQRNADRQVELTVGLVGSHHLPVPFSNDFRTGILAGRMQLPQRGFITFRFTEQNKQTERCLLTGSSLDRDIKRF